MRRIGGILDGIIMAAQVFFVNGANHLGLLDEILGHASADIDNARLPGLLDQGGDLIGIGDLVNIEIERSTQVVVDTVRETVEASLGRLKPVLEALLQEKGLSLDDFVDVPQLPKP